MINFISISLSKFLYHENIIPEEMIDEYDFGFQITLANIVNFIMVFVIGIVKNAMLEAAIYYLIFVTLRRYCGGYHSRSRIRCFLLFALTSYLCLFCSQQEILLNLSGILLLLSTLLLATCICLFAPIENKNKYLEDDKKVQYKRYSQYTLIIWAVGAVLFYVFKQYYLVSVCSITFVSVSILMLIGRKSLKQKHF